MSEAEHRKAIVLCRLIQDSGHLAAILGTMPHAKRKRAYGEMKPHLTFTPKPFFMLKFH